MSNILVTAGIENLADLYDAERGLLAKDGVRRVEVSAAVGDPTGSTLFLPQRLITQLGLLALKSQSMGTTTAAATRQRYGTVRLTVQGRDCNCDVIAVPDDCPVRIGRVILVMLDFVVDPEGQRLIGNPEHGGEPMIELYSYF